MVKGLPINRNAVYAALFSPQGEHGELKLDVVRELIRYELAHGVEGFYVCGSSGEGLLLDLEERKELAQTVAEEVAGKVPFIVHTGSLSTRQAIELSQHAETLGAAAVSMIPPIYYNYTPDEVMGYYEDVIHNVGLGVIIYNIPQFTGISFSKDSKLMYDPRIIGIKHTSMNLYDLERIAQAFPEKVIINGHDETWLFSQVAGATALVGTTVNICPKLYASVRDNFRAGNIAKAQEEQHMVNDFIEALCKAGIFPAAKYCLTLLGVDVGPCRHPFLPLDEERKKMTENALSKLEAYL